MRKFMISSMLALLLIGSVATSAEARPWRWHGGYYYPSYSYYSPEYSYSYSSPVYSGYTSSYYPDDNTSYYPATESNYTSPSYFYRPRYNYYSDYGWGWRPYYYRGWRR
jgi:hypothetical protein